MSNLPFNLVGLARIPFFSATTGIYNVITQLNMRFMNKMDFYF